MPTGAKSLLPTDQEARIARETSERLAPLVSRDGKAHLYIRADSDQETELLLPLPALRLLLDVLQELGKGNGVTITPMQKEMTTQQAADFLMVSRPYLIVELLEKGKIPYRKVGNRRRIRYDDLLRYRAEEEQEIARREKVMLELMAETERLGLYK
ncbi:MAG TPA: helix-turn-helix domain-containing protein [Chthonomonadaceae bacterium]|nr:helix-turn-helix domain-containing protein [Chthonomonadaceae bacterium]